VYRRRRETSDCGVVDGDHSHARAIDVFEPKDATPGMAGTRQLQRLHPAFHGDRLHQPRDGRLFALYRFPDHRRGFDGGGKPDCLAIERPFMALANGLGKNSGTGRRSIQPSRTAPAAGSRRSLNGTARPPRLVTRQVYIQCGEPGSLPQLRSPPRARGRLRCRSIFRGRGSELTAPGAVLTHRRCEHGLVIGFLALFGIALLNGG
jgi:hypothetical protein